MNWGAPYFLFGFAAAVVFGVILLVGALRAEGDRGKFGDLPRVRSLTTHDAGHRRAWKGLLLILATALAFVAAARPQYGRGTRLIPATNVDVVIVLDYSKSMYARDVEPNRIFRAKGEISRLIRDLPSARFGAVAFAGEPMGFPLTADGGAISQFLRNLEPNDMPVGGTAIGRALDQAWDLLDRDPKSEKHKRYIILVTDGEDLEGDPVDVAESIGRDGTTIHVVQIGGRTPERIPEMGDDGRILGWRKTTKGRPMTTELTAKGERQLEEIAAATPGGRLIRAEKGSTGIDEVAAELRRQMDDEYGEKVETVYADVYYYPLIGAIVLLLVELVITDAPARWIMRPVPPPARPRRFARQPLAPPGFGATTPRRSADGEAPPDRPPDPGGGSRA